MTGPELRSIKDQSGLTAEQFADELGVAVGTLRGYMYRAQWIEKQIPEPVAKLAHLIGGSS